MFRRKPAESRRRGLVPGAMLAAFLVAASGTAHAQDLSCGKGDVEVRSLKFEGNKAISDDELALRVNTTPSAAFRRNLHVPLGAKRCLNRAYLPRDLAAIELFYLERGYYSAKADTVITRVGREAVRVTFRIVEGPVTVLDSLTVSGLEGVADSASIIRSLRVKQGDPFSIALYLADLDSLTRRLRNEGYYRAYTVQAFTRDGLNAKVEIPIVPGRRARFGTPVIHITPLNDRPQQVPDNVVRRIMGISAGAYFSDRAITEAQRSLFQMGVYRHVEVAPQADSLQPPGDSIIVLDVRLSEDLTHRLDTEYGWATLDCGRMRAQYTDLNFLHSARRFEFTGQASKIGYGIPLKTDATRKICTPGGDKNPLQQDSLYSDSLHYYVGASFRQPRLLGTKWIPTLSFYTERRGEFKAYRRTTQFGADVSATRDLGQRTQFRVGYTNEVGRTEAPDAVLCALFSRCDDASRARILRKATLGVASATVSRVQTDNLISPTRGSVIRAEYRTSAARLFGTSTDLFFHKASFETVLYQTVGWGNVLSLRLRAGAVEGVGASFIPPQERLYAGGTNSLRGFQQNELGDAVYIARASDGALIKGDTTVTPVRFQVDSVGFGYDRVVPLGGNRLAVANLEYRVRDAFLFPNVLQYTFFIDAGDVWNQGKSKPQIKYTPGVGIRLTTGVGTIQLNAGYNRYPPKSGQIYFEDPTLAESSISPLYCVSPGNTIDLVKTNGVFQAPPGSPACEATYRPAARTKWYQRLVFTFSIGPDF
jgi:outer membrane protein assembly factor BamA